MLPAPDMPRFLRSFSRPVIQTASHLRFVRSNSGHRVSLKFQVTTVHATTYSVPEKTSIS